MSSNEIAIQITGLSKRYEIYDRASDRLKQFILPKLAKLLRKNSKNYFRDFWALKDLSFELQKGETVGIIGRNGSGKSTLLQIICGTVSPTYGEVIVNGRVAALLELGSGFNQEFTGRENVYLNAAVLGLTEEQIRSRFSAIEDFADIGEFIDQPVKTYSSGMLLRLAFAVIAHVDADILVIDEALAVGDAFFTQKCMRFLRNFMKSGTILFVSHDTAAIVNLCNKAILLDLGKIKVIGHPKKVSSIYLEELYKSRQETNKVWEKTGVDKVSDPSFDYYDMRKDLINSSNLRNDICVFNFNNKKNGFGIGGANITTVKLLLESSGAPLDWVVGGEDVILLIECRVNENLNSPIVGFEFKDRLGQILFCDNTYLSHKDLQLRCFSGSRIICRFEFRLPLLPAGAYSVDVAIASGLQEDHIQHHWVHDALVLESTRCSVINGLVGLPIKNISLEIL
jgi:lipopolysaccharide transport system ATP-binding protein